MGDLFEGGTLLDIHSSVTDWRLSKGQFLTYRKIVHAFSKLWSIRDVELGTHEVIQTLYTFGHGRRLVSWLYRAILAHSG